MKSSLCVVLVVLVSILSVACGASVRAGADWKGAYDAERNTCDRQRSPSQDVYVACLEHQDQVRREQDARIAALPQPTASANVPPPTPTASANVPPTAVPPQAVPPRVSIISPESSGYVCDAPKSMILVVDNPNVDYLVEVRSPALKPLDCEAGLWVRHPVVRQSGQVDLGPQGLGVVLIPPRMKVRMVALPYNGGLGKVRVEFSLVLNPGASNIPAPQVGDMVRMFEFPRGNNEPHYQDVNMHWFRMFGR